MKNEFHAIPTVEGWQLSNPAILSMAAIRASLEVFGEAGGMQPLRQKSIQLTGYLESLLRQVCGDRVRLITPQTSNDVVANCRSWCSPLAVASNLPKNSPRSGVMTDWREPNVIRVAPAPLYNSFEDVFRFVQALKQLLT